MIKVKFSEKEDKSIHLKVKGHSGTAKKGQDLVCAGATMLAYTLAQYLKFLEGSGMLKKKPKVSISDGRATIDVMPVEDAYAETLHAYLVIQAGFHVLARNYPEAVQLTAFGQG